jgi:hypothetical protein
MRIEPWIRSVVRMTPLLHCRQVDMRGQDCALGQTRLLLGRDPTLLLLVDLIGIRTLLELRHRRAVLPLCAPAAPGMESVFMRFVGVYSFHKRLIVDIVTEHTAILPEGILRRLVRSRCCILFIVSSMSHFIYYTAC